MSSIKDALEAWKAATENPTVERATFDDPVKYAPYQNKKAAPVKVSKNAAVRAGLLKRSVPKQLDNPTKYSPYPTTSSKAVEIYEINVPTYLEEKKS